MVITGRIFLILIVSMWLMGSTDKKTAISVLDDAGFSDIEINGRNMLSCGGEFYRTSFIAKNQNGKVVDGTVCSSIFFKGSTIRF